MINKIEKFIDKNGIEFFEGDWVIWDKKRWPVWFSKKMNKIMLGDKDGCEFLVKGRDKYCEKIITPSRACQECFKIEREKGIGWDCATCSVDIDDEKIIERIENKNW